MQIHIVIHEIAPPEGTKVLIFGGNCAKPLKEYWYIHGGWYCDGKKNLDITIAAQVAWEMQQRIDCIVGKT